MDLISIKQTTCKQLSWSSSKNELKAIDYI